MMATVINCGPAILLAATVIPGVFYQTHHFDKRFEDLKEHFNKRFEDQRDHLSRRFEDQRDLIKSETERLEDRLERLEHPLYRPYPELPSSQATTVVFFAMIACIRITYALR